MNARPAAWLLAALLSSSCTLVPPPLPQASSSLTLRLKDLYPAERQTQVLLATSKARVTVRGPGIDQPLTVTVPVSGNSVQANLTGIPAGPNRLIELFSLDEDDEAIPGARFRTTATLKQGANTATLSPATTPRGDVFAALLAEGSPLASTLEADLLQTRIEAIYRTLRVPHFGLIDGEKIARALVANGGKIAALPTDDPTFKQEPASLRVKLAGLPANLPAEVWLDDPVSPKQSSATNGTLVISPAKPGKWTLYARAGSMRIGPEAVTLNPGAETTAKALDFSRRTETRATLPAARGGAAYGMLTLDLGDGEKPWLVLAGGIAADGATSSVVAFDGQSWTSLGAEKAMPHAVSHAAFTVHENELWVLGGISGGAATTHVQVFDATQKTWRTEAPLDGPSAMGSVGIASDTIILSPGIKAWPFLPAENRFDFQIPEQTFERPLAGGDWEPIGVLTPPRFGASSITHAGRIYFIGGHVAGPMSSAPVLAVNVYDPATETKSAIAPIPTPRLGATAWVHGGKIIVAGGITAGGKALDHVEAYDLARDRWEILPPMRTPRGHAASGILGGKAVIAGGHDNPFFLTNLVPLDLVEAISP